MSHTNHSVCPACKMKSNLDLQRNRPKMSEELLLFQSENNLALTRQELVTFVSLAPITSCDSLVLILQLYSGHSFRIGGATSASFTGLPNYEIQVLGHWKSACYKTHVRSRLSALLQFPHRTAKTVSITYQYANTYHQNTRGS